MFPEDSVHLLICPTGGPRKVGLLRPQDAVPLHGRFPPSRVVNRSPFPNLFSPEVSPVTVDSAARTSVGDDGYTPPLVGK